MLRHWVCCVAAAHLVAAQVDVAIAPGWSAPATPSYQSSVDRTIAHSGKSSLMVKAIAPNPQGYAVRQKIRADAFRGKRIRLSGWLKPDDAIEGGALWLRIDMLNGDYILDSMMELSGRTQQGWTRREVVAQVPNDAVGISFGLRMIGQGRIWADDLMLEVLTQPVMTTTIERRKDQPRDYRGASLKAVNLGFEGR